MAMDVMVHHSELHASQNHHYIIYVDTSSQPRKLKVPMQLLFHPAQCWCIQCVYAVIHQTNQAARDKSLVSWSVVIHYPLCSEYTWYHDYLGIAISYYINFVSYSNVDIVYIDAPWSNSKKQAMTVMMGYANACFDEDEWTSFPNLTYHSRPLLFCSHMHQHLRYFLQKMLHQNPIEYWQCQSCNPVCHLGLVQRFMQWQMQSTIGYQGTAQMIFSHMEFNKFG